MGSWYFCASYAAALCLADLSSGCLPVFVHMAFIHFSALKMICFCQEIYSKDGVEAGSVVCCWFHSYPFQYLHRSVARTMIKIKDLPLCSSQCHVVLGVPKPLCFTALSHLHEQKTLLFTMFVSVKWKKWAQDRFLLRFWALLRNTDITKIANSSLFFYYFQLSKWRSKKHWI